MGTQIMEQRNVKKKETLVFSSNLIAGFFKPAFDLYIANRTNLKNNKISVYFLFT